MIMAKQSRPVLVGFGQPAPGQPQQVPNPDSASHVIWSFLIGVTGFGMGIAIGTIWGAKALRGG